MDHALKLFARIVKHEDWRTLPWERMTPEVIYYAVREAEAQGYKPSTLKRMAVAIRGIAKIAWRRALIGERELDALEQAALSYTKQVWAPKVGRRLTLEETRQQIEYAGTHQMRLLVALGVIFGLRRGELCDLECGSVVVELKHLRVVGKGKKVRFVPLPAGFMAELAAFAAGRPLESPLFLTERHIVNHHGGPRGGKKISRRQMHSMLRWSREQAKVEWWAPHDLRRTSVTQLLEAGHDPILVARAVGHSSVTTTMAYDRRGDEVTREAFAGVMESLAPSAGSKG